MRGVIMRRVFTFSSFLLFAGCASGGETDSRPIPGAWSGDIQSLGAEGHAGFATVTLMPDGETRANITLRGGAAGGRHPWHIHAGLCPSGDAESAAVGPEVGDPQAYPVLEPNDTGNASATAVLGVPLDPDAEYHVDIHQSDEDSSVVGCGDLQRSF
ncbi:MAG TPA: hypothetical protein VFS53_01135 [Gemmatimonadota bacterium]|nr:hypothetical protein [Gemmatimonadota bacterium]